MFPTPIEQTRPLTRRAYRIGIPLLLLIWLLPILAVAMMSVRTPADMNSGNYWGLPSSWSGVSNYLQVFRNTPLLNYIINSFEVTVPAVIGSIALASLAGYALGVYRFRANLAVFFLFVGGNFVPAQILMVPVRQLSLHLGLYNSTLGLTLFHTAFQSGFCTFFLRNFIRDLPRELIEAARIEGAGELRIFLRIVLPLIRPAMAALAVLIFTFVWNDYFWATVLTQGSHAMPVTGGLMSLNGQWISQWQLVAAGSILAALPPVVMFFAMQRHFIAGLTLGATKG
jgi:multiple sugar transport system permease protein